MSRKDAEEGHLHLREANLLAQRAGEEFVAAGRGEKLEREAHRKRALFLVDALQALRRRI